MRLKLLLLAFLMSTLAFAQFIDEKEAREIAAIALNKGLNKNKVINKSRKTASEDSVKHYEIIDSHLELHRVVKDDEGNNPCFYVFNKKGEAEGFAIVSNQGQILIWR